MAVAVFQTTDVAVPEMFATGQTIFGFDVKLTSTVRFAGTKTNVVLSKAHSNTMFAPTGNKGGFAAFCLGWIIDSRLTGRRGSITELGPTTPPCEVIGPFGPITTPPPLPALPTPLPGI